MSNARLELQELIKKDQIRNERYSEIEQIAKKLNILEAQYTASIYRWSSPEPGSKKECELKVWDNKNNKVVAYFMFDLSDYSMFQEAKFQVQHCLNLAELAARQFHIMSGVNFFRNYLKPSSN